jgi:hypothetical protein
VRALSAQEIISLWEWGRGRKPPEQALGFLAATYPRASWEELASLAIGRRDARLLALRERTMGPVLQGFASCPQCGEQIEFTIDTDDLQVGEGDPGGNHELEGKEYRVRFRMPNSLDLLAAARCADTPAAERELLRRCVIEVSRDEEPLSPESLPESVVASLAERMEDLDPMTELRLGLNCPKCCHRWSILLDIASFFLREISVLARRLALEVHTLARAYGWREADILAMSPARRGLYLETAAG